MLLGIGITVLVLIIGVGIWAFIDYRKNSKTLNIRIARYGIIIFICGILIHFAGIRYNQTDNLWLINTINILIRSVKMFGWDFNSEILGAAMNANSVFAVAVFFTFILAQASILYLLLILFNVLILNNIKVKINKNKDHFVILGDTSYSEYFVDDLKANNYKYITIITNKESDDVRKKWIAKGVAVINKKVTVDTLDVAGIISFTNKVTVVSFLDNDDENLNVGIQITNYIKDKLKEKYGENELENKIKKLNLVCSIQYKNIDRSEHFRFSSILCGKMRFFNKYDLLARDFIFKYPITSLLGGEHFDFDKAKLKQEVKIANVFVGFGRTNRQMLIKSLCNNQMLDHDYTAIVYDKFINDRKLEFQKTASGIFESFEQSNDYFVSPTEKYNIEFSELNVLSKTFYESIKKVVQENTFIQIIISLGSDSANLEIALELRQVIREIELLDRVKIFSFQKYDKHSAENLRSLNLEYDPKYQINFIGNEKSVFTYDVLINEKYDEIAKRIAFNYEKSTKDNVSISEAWNNLTIFAQESNRFAAYGIRVKLNLLGLDLISTTEEGITEDEYFKHLKISEEELNILDKAKKNKGKYYEIYLKDKNNQFIDNPRNNLARLEHLRWNTVHLVNGWSKYPKDKLSIKKDDSTNDYKVIRKDESIKKHACITTFEGLDKLTEVSVRLFENIDVKDALLKNQTKDDYVMKLCETIRHDYTVMDNLFGMVLKDSPYKVVKK